MYKNNSARFVGGGGGGNPILFYVQTHYRLIKYRPKDCLVVLMVFGYISKMRLFEFNDSFI